MKTYSAELQAWGDISSKRKPIAVAQSTPG